MLAVERFLGSSTAQWQAGHAAFQERAPSGTDYAYLRVDGIPEQARLLRGLLVERHERVA